MSDKPEAQKAKLRKIHGDMVARANHFEGQKGLFSGELISEELAHFARQLWDVYDAEN